MTVIQMNQVSAQPLAVPEFQPVWEEPEILDEEDPELDAIEFPDIETFVSESVEQPAIIGGEDGNINND